jgi:hypothetical protein
VVGEVDAGAGLTAAAEVFDPAVVICGACPQDGAAVLAGLLFDRPRMRVLVIHGDGRWGQLVELAPRRTHLAELSPALLLMAVRGEQDVQSW